MDKYSITPEMEAEYREILAQECFGVSFKELDTDDRLSIFEAMMIYGLLSKRKSTKGG